MRWILVLILAVTSAIGRADDGNWKAGVATVEVIPSQSMWMAGYASRTKPSEGAMTELNAKALAVEDSAGTRAVIVTTDLISIPRLRRQQVAKAVAAAEVAESRGAGFQPARPH